MDQNTPRIIYLDRYYASPEECCIVEQISRPTMQRRIRDGKLQSIKIGMTRLVEKRAGLEAGPNTEPPDASGEASRNPLPRRLRT